MKTRQLLLISTCLFALVGCSNYRDRAVLSAGTWAVERMEIGGHEEPPEHFEIVFSPHGNAITITVGSKVHKGSYELQSDKNPKEIEIKPDATNNEDKALHGIYELDADGQGLVLCLSPKKRPKEFRTKPDNDWVLIKLRRQ